MSETVNAAVEALAGAKVFTWRTPTKERLNQREAYHKSLSIACKLSRSTN